MVMVFSGYLPWLLVCHRAKFFWSKSGMFWVGVGGPAEVDGVSASAFAALSGGLSHRPLLNFGSAITTRYVDTYLAKGAFIRG